MRKVIGLILLLNLTSCSYNTDFYIFNTTDKPIIVVYESGSNGKVFVKDPRIVEFDSDFETREIKNAYEYEIETIANSKKQIITCELKSGQALWIGYDLNFTLTNPNETRIIKENLVELTVEQNGKQLIYADEKNIVDYFETLELQVVGIKVRKASR